MRLFLETKNFLFPPYKTGMSTSVILRILHNEEVVHTTSSLTMAGEVSNEGEEMGVAVHLCQPPERCWDPLKCHLRCGSR